MRQGLPGVTSKCGELGCAVPLQFLKRLVAEQTYLPRCSRRACLVPWGVRLVPNVAPETETTWLGTPPPEANRTCISLRSHPVQRRSLSTT